MRVLRLAAVCLCGLASPACLVATLHPVYEPETIAFDPALLGRWVAAEDQAQASPAAALTFERGEWHSYHLEIDTGRERVRASARLTRAGDRLLLDVSPLDGTDLPPFVVPVHVPYQVGVEADTLALAELDYDALEAAMKEGRAGVEAVVDGRRNIVVTAGTADLRRWIASRSGDDDPFAAPTIFKRSD